MTPTFRNPTLGIALVLLGTALPPPPSALAQGVDLSGVWKIDDAFVRITQSATTVRADFISGAECFDGYVRPHFLIGELSTTIAAAAIGASLTGTMIVCSGSPDLVRQCGLPSWYQTTFRTDSVEADRISGTRLGQRVESCRPAGPADSRQFTLTRLSCAELEQAWFEAAESLEVLRQRSESIVAGARDAFVAAHSAAQKRYGDTYNGPTLSGPTNRLQTPYLQLGEDYPTAERYFERLSQTLVTNPDGWESARLMAEAMARFGDAEPGEAYDPLPEAARMVEAMDAVESVQQEGQGRLDEHRNARLLLEACGLAQ
jgi:hypothetical protein